MIKTLVLRFVMALKGGRNSGGWADPIEVDFRRHKREVSEKDETEN